MAEDLEAAARRARPPQLNVPLRVAAFWLGYSAIFVGLGLVLGLAPPAVRMLVAGLLVTLASIALTAALTRSEGGSLAAVGAGWSSGSVTRFSTGIAFGGAMVALLVALSRIALGPISFARSPGATASTVLLMSATFIALSAGEELGFRGYPFQRLRDRYGVGTAQVVVALAFAAYHLLQGWPLVNALVGTTAGSVLFGMAVLASRGLAFPIGMHAAWNLGSWVLGTKGEAGYWRMDLAGQPSFVALTAVYLGVMVVSTAALWWWMRRAGGTLPVGWASLRSGG
ncbi:MAG TPA: type II CAAX endopeptidase family protein [Gemmatimonadaceae bacterium]|nr:type II CAAX endopeptidase family protein [Gemmatimonadaceae bacterium]